VLRKGGEWARLEGTVERVKSEVVPTTVVSMAHFDRFETASPPVVAPNGSLRRVMDDQVRGMAVTNALQDVFVRGEESEEYPDLFSEAEGSEFLTRLLGHLVRGGAMNQYDDTLAPYLETTKALYKDLLSVVRPQGSDRIEVLSAVYCVRGLQGGGADLFPQPHDNNFCYVVLDTARKTATVLYRPHQGWW